MTLCNNTGAYRRGGGCILVLFRSIVFAQNNYTRRGERWVVGYRVGGWDLTLSAFLRYADVPSRSRTTYSYVHHNYLCFVIYIHIHQRFSNAMLKVHRVGSRVLDTARIMLEDELAHIAEAQANGEVEELFHAGQAISILSSGDTYGRRTDGPFAGCTSSRN